MLEGSLFNEVVNTCAVCHVRFTSLMPCQFRQTVHDALCDNALHMQSPGSLIQPLNAAVLTLFGFRSPQ